VVLGVPSNDFGAQEPGSNQEIRRFCETGFGVGFPLTAKQAVIGGGAHPLYRWIVDQLGEDQAPRWNFHKYLIGRDGELIDAWPSRVAPQANEITAAIEAALAA
jgi:glutathione peroxidase